MNSEVIREENGIWHAAIVYAYRMNGNEYESDVINPNGELRIGFSNKPARRRVEKYLAGSSVIVYVNPVDPTMSFLEAAPSSASRYRFIIGGVLAAVGIGILASALGSL